MATPHVFPHATVLSQLEQPGETSLALPALSPLFVQDAAGQWQRTEPADALLKLLQAQRTLLQSAVDVTLVADELRRYQKFSPAGRPPMQLVQLRRQQASVQQAARIARQAYIRSADGFTRAAELAVPAKLGLIAFVERWLETRLPASAPALTPAS